MPRPLRTAHRPHCVRRAVGGFVRHLCQRLTEEAERDAAVAPLLVNVDAGCSSPGARSSPPRRAPLLDVGVYSRYRSFRLLWSRKNKPHAPALLVHHSNRYRAAASQRALFLHSCVQFHQPSSAAQRATDGKPQWRTLTWPPHPEGAEPQSWARSEGVCASQLSPIAVRGPPERRVAVVPCAALCASSWSAMEHWLARAWPAEPRAASVRRWSAISDATGYSGSAGLLLLCAVQGSRWCARVRRPHRSNAIYFLVHARFAAAADPEAAAAAAASLFSSSCSALFFTQRCHDPDCRGFTSPPVDAPPDLLQAVRWEEQREMSRESEAREHSTEAANLS